jgi:type II secretory pathway pseudopilin PulG
MKCSRVSEAGMTLVEAVVVIGISTVLMLAITSAVQALFQQNSYTFDQAYEVDNARRGINRFLQDAREMAYSENGNFPLAVIAPDRIGFYSDIDKDNKVEYVEYVTTSTSVTKKTYNPIGTPPTYNLNSPDQTIVLSSYVQNKSMATSTFYYYNNSGTRLSSTSPLTSVRYIQAQIIVNVDPIRAPGEFLLRVGIAPRNLKDNL